MKKTQFIMTLSLLAGGVAFAGPVAYEKIVVPEPVCGPWYASLYGGGSFFDDGQIQESNVLDATPESAEMHFDNGWILGGAIGVATDTGWRFELDIHHHQAPGDDVTARAFGGAVTGNAALLGDIETTSLMLNAVREFGSLSMWNLRPYLGAGIGLSNVEGDLFSPLGTALIDDTVFGYQFMGGLVFDVTECLQGYVEYRVTSHGDIEDGFYTAPGTPSNLDLGWQQHVIIGLRYFF